MLPPAATPIAGWVGPIYLAGPLLPASHLHPPLAALDLTMSFVAMLGWASGCVLPFSMFNPLLVSALLPSFSFLRLPFQLG